MEGIRKIVQENLEKKSEVLGIHAKAILNKNIADAREINKRMDALCMDEEIAKGILWEEIYKEVKSKLEVKKPFFNPENKEELLILPEFQEFFKKYVLYQEKQQQLESQEKELANKNAVMTEIDLPQDIQKAKEKINELKKTIREIIDEKQEKNEWAWKTAMAFIKKSTIDEAQKKEKANLIYDFIFDHMETSWNKKKRKIAETSCDFYKRLGIDYMVNDIRKALQDEEKKNNEKINKWKTRIRERIKAPKQEKQEQKDYEKEALELFRKKINDFPSIKERFYLPEEREDMKHIQKYAKKQIEETIPSPDLELFIKNRDLPLHTIAKEGETITIHPIDYIEIERRKMEHKKRFIHEDRNAKEYLFDRLIEYIGKDILGYKIQKSINQNPIYKGTTFTIEKTDPLDDTSAWADYIVTYNIPWKQKKRIAAVDLFISDKSWGKDLEEENEDQRKKKNEGAKIGRIPYSTYLNLFPNKKEEHYAMQPLKRYVEQQDPTLVYTVLAQTLRNAQPNINKLLQSFETKGELYNIIQNTSKENKWSTTWVERQFRQNILNELEKVAA